MGSTSLHRSSRSGPVLPPFPDDIPVAPLVTVSLRKLVDSSTSAEHERLFSAAKGLGFFYLDVRGTHEGENLLQQAHDLFDLMNEFFSLPVEEKANYDFAAKKIYFGYKGIGKEVVDGKGTKDKNEIYNISKDDLLSITSPLPAPTVIATKRTTLISYVATNTTILKTLFTSLSTSLQLPPDTLGSLHKPSVPSGCHIRFISAPPQEASTRSNALGEHTDFGSLTILLNRLGGLQVQLPGTQEWVYVRPIPGCAIVNLGDAMVKFSGGILRSNLHRVVSPPGEQAKEVRRSLVYFARPEHDITLKRLKGGLMDELDLEDVEGDEVSTREWLARRHIGRKIEFFEGKESWEGSMGTEARPLVVTR